MLQPLKIMTYVSQNNKVVSQNDEKLSRVPQNNDLVSQTNNKLLRELLTISKQWETFTY